MSISTIAGFLLLEMQNIEINDPTIEEKAMKHVNQQMRLIKSICFDKNKNNPDSSWN